MCSFCLLNLAFDWLFLSRYQVHFKKYHIMIAYSRDYPNVVYDTVVVVLRLSCLVGSLSSWVSPW